MNILDGKIKFQGLDPTAPYSLGNAYYFANKVINPPTPESELYNDAF